MRSFRRIVAWLWWVPGLLGGCASLGPQRLTLPDRYTVVRDPLLIHTDFPLAANHRLLEELSARRGDLQTRLGLPLGGEPIHVYLFENAETFGQFVRLHHPDFPRRRAFFLETDTTLHVYAQWGDRVAEDLRHEVTHGYLHSALPHLPIWLDEGLAEYSEAPRAYRGLNRDNLEQIVPRLKMGDWHPNLARLEALDPSKDMTVANYTESWAWVHFLMEGPVEVRDVLCDFLTELRHDGTARPVSARLRAIWNDPEAELVAHVRRLAVELGL